jgi:hypothetical protein
VRCCKRAAQLQEEALALAPSNQPFQHDFSFRII